MSGLRRTPPPEDAAVLRYAGIMGHTFILVSTWDGKRRVSVHASSPEIDTTGHRDPAIYQKTTTRVGWSRVR